MPFEELKDYRIPTRSGNVCHCYLKSDVDTVIKKKDRAIEFAKALALKDIEIIKEKDKEIAELKQKLEDAQASAYAESVDAGMENRRLKRALWLARAERAHLKVLEYWPDYCHNAHCRIAEQKWDKVERKCRAMAEKYK